MSNERIEQLVKDFPVQTVCKVLDVSRSALYKRMDNKRRGVEPYRVRQDARLGRTIAGLFYANRGAYGRPRIARSLTKLGIHISDKRLARLMRERGLKAKRRRKFKKTTHSDHDNPIAPNIVKRRFNSATGPNQIWCSDITYISTKDRWIYLCVVIDLFSRKVVGWSIADHMETSLVQSALMMAIRRRRPGRGVVFHSDRGSQYASHAFRKDLTEGGFVQSMSRSGDCWDNAVAESWNDKVKQELVSKLGLMSKDEVEMQLFEYIEVFYNHQRIHSSLDYMTPTEFESNFSSRQEVVS